MTDATSPFTFVAEPAAFREASVLVVRVPAAARGKEKLFGVLARGLRFPRYFGRNWDAFEECLADLSWLDGTDRVAIVHEGLPFAPTGELLRTYCSILRDVAAARKRSDVKPTLDVVFAESLRDAIEAASA